VRDGTACNHDIQEALFTPLGKLIDRRLSADALPRCKSPFGVFNLVGNVDEWTTRTTNEAPMRSILRGGWWLQGRNRCRAATDSHQETYAGPQTGFRCCKAARS
jgi:formylglycine-generating enzyme required for sulfatase activity